MRQYLNPVAGHLVKALDLEPAGVSARDDHRRAAQILAIKTLALPPGAVRAHFRKPRLQPVLQVPDDRHVRQINLHRFRADEPQEIDAHLLAQLFETRLAFAIFKQRVESAFGACEDAFAKTAGKSDCFHSRRGQERAKPFRLPAEENERMLRLIDEFDERLEDVLLNGVAATNLGREVFEKYGDLH